ncbi:hypothetical protein BV898_15554 [Hypsibius exemplaris]|uniref:G-protein coupled receptors family 1 profile domain-containing protein n=1 Tax=Hypsibius exemplaris TaxID=2072580 RepID=A0A9X6RKL6_HYPEX|nr:hypothetical protein BV898_15554 [Hypsibius exemplaris]
MVAQNVSHFLSASSTTVAVVSINNTIPTVVVPPDRPLYWLVSVLLTTGFATFANAVLLTALLINRKLRESSSSPLLIHIISLELLKATLAVPIYVLPLYLGPTWILPAHFCPIQHFIVYVTFEAELYADSLIAVHRLIATVMPRHFKRINRPRTIVMAVSFPWVVSILGTIFPVMGVGVDLVPFNSTTTGGCTPLLKKGSVDTVSIETVFGVYVPTAVTGISYAIILIKTCSDICRGTASRALRRRFAISRVLVLSFVWSSISLTPFNIVNGFFAEEFAQNMPVQEGLCWLSTSFSAINPVSSKPFQSYTENPRSRTKGASQICIETRNGTITLSHIVSRKQLAVEDADYAVTHLLSILLRQNAPYRPVAHSRIFFWASSKMFQDGVKDVFYGMVCRKRTASVEPSRFFTGTRRGTEGTIHPDHSQTRM